MVKNNSYIEDYKGFKIEVIKHNKSAFAPQGDYAHVIYDNKGNEYYKTPIKTDNFVSANKKEAFIKAKKDIDSQFVKERRASVKFK